MRRGEYSDTRAYNARTNKIRGRVLNKTLSSYIKSCDIETLLNLFEEIVNEINKRKEKSRKENNVKYFRNSKQ